MGLNLEIYERWASKTTESLPKSWMGEGGLYLPIYTNSSWLKWKGSCFPSSHLRIDDTAVKMWHYRMLHADVDMGVTGAYITSEEEGT